MLDKRLSKLRFSYLFLAKVLTVEHIILQAIGGKQNTLNRVNPLGKIRYDNYFKDWHTEVKKVLCKK